MGIILEELMKFMDWAYDVTIGSLIRLQMDVIETVLFWTVPELPSEAIQTQWSLLVCILALCAILYAILYIIFTDNEDLKFNYRYFFLGILFMRGGLEIGRDALMIVTAATSTMLSMFDNPVSAFFHLLAGGAIALLVATLPIILYIIGIAMQIFIILIIGYLLCIAGIYYIIPIQTFKEKGDAIVKIVIGALGLAIFNAGLLMLTLFASSGAGLNIISRFLLGVGYICVMVIVMYKIFAWSTSNEKYERSDIMEIALIPNTKKVRSALKRAMRW